MNGTPTPARLYVHDDLVTVIRDGDSLALTLAQQLMALVKRDVERVNVLMLEDQIAALIARASHEPFSLTLGIGRAGERVARQVHASAGWFPSIRRIDLAREEDGRGGYAVLSPAGVPLERQLASVDFDAADSVAIVDDTIFSGITMSRLLGALPPAVLGRTHAFCLRCVEESLPPLRAIVSVDTGFFAAGRPPDDVSLINASGLVRPDAIRRAGRPPLAFFERPEWMHAWFPGHADSVIDCCRRLNPLLPLI